MAIPYIYTKPRPINRKTTTFLVSRMPRRRARRCAKMGLLGTVAKNYSFRNCFRIEATGKTQ
jgi:hypothetical protein